MDRIVFFVSFLAIVSILDAASPNPTVDSHIEPKALYHAQQPFVRNALVQRVQCVTETIDSVVIEYRCQPVWLDVQRNLQNNIGNIFGCLRYTGFTQAGCVVKEVLSLGISMNSLLNTLDADVPEAGKELRLRVGRNCASSRYT